MLGISIRDLILCFWTLQLLPYYRRHQIIYLIFRWLVALYFLGWFIAKWPLSTEIPSSLFHLTTWGFTSYNMYLLIAAVSTTVSYYFTCKRDERDFSREDDFAIKKPSGYSGYAENKIRWYQMIHWLFFTIGSELAIVIMILYWSLLYRPGHTLDGFTLHVHLINGLVALLDLWVSGIPVNFLHGIYLMIFLSVYVVIDGIYYSITGDAAYYVLDYHRKLGISIGVVILTLFVIVPILHTIVYCMHLGKVWILYRFFRRRQPIDNITVEERETLTEETEETDEVEVV